MISRLCEPEHLIIVILVLLMALLIVGGAKGIGKSIGTLVRKFFGGNSVNVNLGGGMAKKSTECATCGLVVDPKNCPLHEAEHERSMRNEKTNEEQWKAIEKLATEMRAGFREVQVCINESQKVIIGALGSRPRGTK